MNKTIIVGNLKISERLGEILGEKVIRYHRKSFSDGEYYVRLQNMEIFKKSKNVVVVVQEKCFPEFDPNRIVMESILIGEVIRSINKNCNLILTLPYTPYSRQDKVFLSGEPISFESFLKILGDVGYNYLITVTLHAKRNLDKFKHKDLEVINIKVPYSVIKYIELINPSIIIGPDTGSLVWISEIGKKLNIEYENFEKYRDRYTGRIKIVFKDVKRDGDVAVIFDDIIAGGSTMKNAIDFLKDKFSKVIPVAIHGIFLKNSIETFKKYNCVVTNTILSDLSKIDVSNDISIVLRNILK